MAAPLPAPPYDDNRVRVARGEHGVRAEDVIIAVMGMTGVGKSTFIKFVSGQEVAIGHNLKACTQDLQVFPMDHPDGCGRRLVLVDTQDFDDDLIEDADVLEKIAEWMGVTYQRGVKLSGLLLLQRISDNRMGGTALKNLGMFKKLVGEESLKNVVLVTTMWGSVDEATGTEREKDLLENPKYWEGMIARGAQHARFLATPESGREIIGLLGDRLPTVIQLQTELIDQNLPVGETAAGVAVDKGLEKMRLEHKQMLEDLKQDHVKAMETNNQRMIEQIRKERSEFEKRMKEIEERRRRLMEKPWWRRFLEGALQVVSFGIVNTSEWE